MLRPPVDEAELRARAAALRGRTLDEVAAALGRAAPAGGLHGKGKTGELLERALGATAGSAGVPDFPHLGIELKTIPLAASGAPEESTFVCTIDLADAERAEWMESRARAKLAAVLWVPLHGEGASRRVGEPLLWRPTPVQEAGLRSDFEEIMGLVGIGGIEALTARVGRWLQVRPKAASGRARTLAHGPDGELIATVPRGFYLRARFTGALLRDPSATP